MLLFLLLTPRKLWLLERYQQGWPFFRNFWLSLLIASLFFHGFFLFGIGTVAHFVRKVRKNPV